MHQFKSSGTLTILPSTTRLAGEGDWLPVRTAWKKYNGSWVRVYPTPLAVPSITPASQALDCYVTFSSKTITYTVSNTGEGDLNILSAAVTANPNFTVAIDYTGFGGSVVTTILPGQTKTFDVTITGTTVGVSSAIITFTADIGALQIGRAHV